MVFFTCNSCGTSVKKNQVEKHFMQCRSRSISCIDCGKDFLGNAYKEHNTCISENQKYGGVNYVPKENSNKNLKKQERWVEIFRAAAANAPRGISQYVERIAEFENIPRKKAKFANFLKSSLRIFDNRIVEQIWSVMEAANKAEQLQSAPQAKPEPEPLPAKRKEPEDEENAVDNSEGKKKKSKPNDTSESGDAPNEEDETEDVVTKGKPFKWIKAIRAELKQANDQQLSIKKLRKLLKVAFESKTGASISKEDIKSKLQDILSNMNPSKYEVSDKDVKFLAIK